MKISSALWLAVFMLVGAQLYGGDRLIVRAGNYSDETMAILLLVEEVGGDQIRYTLSYRPKPQSDHVSRAITTQETHGVAAPLKAKIGRWAFCFEAPNLVWFYDGMQRVTLWTITSERGLSRIDSTVEHTSVGPLVLREWIRK